MSLVTKHFQKYALSTMTEIEAAIDFLLFPDLRFNFGYDTCSVIGGGYKVLFCLTPLALTHAVEFDLPMTYSVTLPERYWRPNTYDYVKSL